MIVRRSPAGLIIRIKLPLNTTKATPAKAMKEPDIRFFFSFSPFTKRCDKIAVKFEAVQTISVTLEANVKPRALFSAMN